jgi:hypothetical protein
MLQKKRLALAVSTALGASVVAVGTAQGGTILFPQIAIGGNVTTVISVINTGKGFHKGKDLHYRYYHKHWASADDNQTGCLERNRYLPTSKFDIQTFDISGAHFGSAGRGVMFLDNSVNNNWDVKPVNYALAEGDELPQRGYLLVSNEDDSRWGDLRGEAVVFEVGLGAAWGYEAFWNTESNDFDFRYTGSAVHSPIAFMPTDEVTTKVLATTLSRDMTALDKQEPGRTTTEAWVGLESYDPEDEGFANGVYDRDEVFYSGGFDHSVRCVAAWSIPELYADAASYDVFTEGGGWANVTNYKRCDNAFGCLPYPYGILTSQAEVNALSAEIKPLWVPYGASYDYGKAAAIFKLEYGTEIDSTPVNGVFNNAVYLHPDHEYYYNIK